MPFSSENSKTLNSFVNAIGASVAVFSKDEHDTYVMLAANRQYMAMLEREEMDGVVAYGLADIFPRYLCLPLSKQMDECLRTQSPVESEVVIDRGGRVSWWRFVFSPVFTERGAARRVLNTCIDITEKKSLQSSLAQSQSRFESVVDAAYDGILSVNEDREIVLMNTAACEIFKVSREEAYGKRLETLIPQRYRERHPDYVASFGTSPIMSRPMETRVTVMGLRSDGTEFPAEVTIAKIKVGAATEFIAVVRDISERARLIEELQRAATNDPLTGVYNRRHLSKILQGELERCRRFGHELTVAMIDLNEFKSINDSHGHHVGDEVLVAFTQAVGKHLRNVDTVGRWGGDEFLIIWPETARDRAERAIAAIRDELADIQERLSKPGTVIEFSHGLFQTDGALDADEVVQRADQILYENKRMQRVG